MDNSSYFRRALHHVLKWEGGYVDHPSDPGGATNHGISLRFYRENIDPEAGAGDIARLSESEAIEIYREYFWLPRFDEFLDYRVAAMLFSTGANMGVARSIRISQQTANNIGFKLKVDGLLGPKTLKAINSLNPDTFLVEFRKMLVLRRLDIAKVKHPFLRGWVRRDLDL